MAVQDERTAMNPNIVASSTISVLKPSTPRKYSACTDGIQDARSTNWNCGSCELYQNHSGSETRKPASANRFATQRMALPFSFGMNSSRTAPASGRKRISDSSGKCATFVTDYLTSK